MSLHADYRFPAMVDSAAMPSSVFADPAPKTSMT